MGGQSKASISQAKQKPQTISPGMTKEVAPLIGQDLNQDTHTKELAWVTLFIVTMNHAVCLCVSESFVQWEPPPKVTPLGKYLEGTSTIVSAIHLALCFLISPHTAAHPYTTSIPSKR